MCSRGNLSGSISMDWRRVGMPEWGDAQSLKLGVPSFEHDPCVLALWDELPATNKTA